MRLIAPLLMVPLIAFAQQPPPGQMDKEQYFQQMKQMMLPMMEKSLPAMEETRSCVEKSGDSAQLNGCVAMAAEFQKEMMAAMGAPADAAQAMPETPKLEWSESLRAEIVRDLAESIRGTTITRECLVSSQDSGAMEACMTRAGMGPPKK